jgi:hypothetical protein
MSLTEGGEALGSLRLLRIGASRLKALAKSFQCFIERFVRRVNEASPDSFGDQLLMFRTEGDSRLIPISVVPLCTPHCQVMRVSKDAVTWFDWSAPYARLRTLPSYF